MTRTFLLVALLTTLLAAAPAAAAPVKVPLTYDHDVVVQNDGTQNDDPGNEPVDAAVYAYGTEGARAADGCAGAAIPNDGVFPADQFHPAVDLDVDAPDTDNAVQLDQNVTQTVSDVPDGKYGQLHVFAATGSGYTNLEATLNYADGSQVVEGVFVADWFNGYPSTNSGYTLANSLAVFDTTTGECTGQGAGIWGLRLPVDATKTLETVTFTIDLSPDGEKDAKLNIFGGLLLSAYDLSVTKDGEGTGTVTSGPAGISCGETCTASFLDGVTVKLRAYGTNGSTFKAWGGACAGETTTACTVTMDQARSVTATFDPKPPPPPSSGGTPPPSDQPPAGSTLPGGPQPHVPVMRDVPFGRMFSGTSNKRCVRRVRLRLKDAADDVISLKLLFGKRTKSVRGPALDLGIVLRRLPKGRFTVRFEGQQANGDTVRAQRGYRRCGARKKRRAA